MMPLPWLRNRFSGLASNKTVPIYIWLFVCSLIAIHPVFFSGFFQGHDLFIEFVRVAEYGHMLKAGEFPVRWGADLEGGYGYPIYNFFPPLFMLIASTLGIAGGLSVLFSIKITLLLLTFSAGVGMYWFASAHFGEKGGLLAASLYVLAPYHFIDVFIRNAFSEFTALAIAPFVFHGLATITQGDQPKTAATIMLTLSIALFVLSHNLSVAMYTPLFLAYFAAVLTANRHWNRAGRAILPVLVAFALTAFYTLPLLAEARFVQTWMLTAGKFDVLENLLPLKQMTAAFVTPLSWFLVIASATSLVIWKRRIPRLAFAVLCTFGAVLLPIVFMVTPASRWVWSQVEFLKWLQFPWRLLSPATFLICFGAGVLAYVPLPDERARRILLYGVVALGAITLIGLSAVNRGSYISIRDQYLTPEKIRDDGLQTTILSEYLPIWAKEKPALAVGKRLTASRPDVLVRQLGTAPGRYRFGVIAQAETVLTAPIYYFPGWKVYVNGQATGPRITGQGLMQFRLPAGQSTVEIKFENTPVRTMANGTSIAGLLLFGYLLLSAYRPFRRRAPRLRAFNRFTQNP